MQWYYEVSPPEGSCLLLQQQQTSNFPSNPTFFPTSHPLTSPPMSRRVRAHRVRAHRNQADPVVAQPGGDARWPAHYVERLAQFDPTTSGKSLWRSAPLFGIFTSKLLFDVGA